MSREGVPKVMPMPPRQPEKSGGADAGSAAAAIPMPSIPNHTAMAVQGGNLLNADARLATADPENMRPSFQVICCLGL